MPELRSTIKWVCFASCKNTVDQRIICTDLALFKNRFALVAADLIAYRKIIETANSGFWIDVIAQ